MARSPPAAVRLSGESKALKKVRALAFNVALHNSAGTTGRWTSARSTAANLRMVSTRARTVARALWSTRPPERQTKRPARGEYGVSCIAGVASQDCCK